LDYEIISVENAINRGKRGKRGRMKNAEE